MEPSQQEIQKGKRENVLIHQSGNDLSLMPKQVNEQAVYTSPVLKSKIEFTDLGMHWIAEKNPLIKIRTSKDQKSWSKWMEVIPDDAEVEHVKNSETFSELLYTGPANYIQYQIHFPKINEKGMIKNIKLTLINPGKGQQDTKENSFSLWKWFRTWFNQADADTNQPDIVTRSEWGADESLRFNEDGSEKWPRQYADQITHLVVHHTNDQAFTDETETLARVRATYYYHTVTKNWGDIGYQALIGPDGKIYEGRKSVEERDKILSSKVIGGHSYGFNNGTFGVSLMGNYEEEPLPENMRKALIKLLSYEANIHNIDPTAKKDFVRNYEYNDPNVPQTDPDLDTILGHRDLPRANTVCPGKYVHQDLSNIRKDVKKNKSVILR